MRALPLELRLRIVAAFDDGLTTEEIAERYSVSLSSVKRFLRLRRESGRLEPRKQTGRVPTLDEDGCQLMRTWLEEKNDLRLGELQARLKGSGYDMCVSAICRRLKGMALTYKKNDARQ
jgi:transposase